MSHRICRTALRFSPSAHTNYLPNVSLYSQRLSPCTSKHPAFSRAFSRSSISRDSESDKRNEELSERARQQEQKLFTSGKSAQTLENDRPWHRQSSHAQPESTSPDPTQGDVTKGRLLTTPTRLLKLILPMPFHPKQEHINEPIEEGKHKDDKVEPLALLVHPQQPLSYLERLIQAEIPPLKVDGREKLPDIVFRAEADEDDAKQNRDPKESNVASYSGLGHEGPDRKHAEWVRWSGSTEVGDFIRDAARGREFAVDIEGHDKELRIAVPSFKDRTYYMRMRLRRTSREIDAMSKVKAECDQLAHKGAHRLAQGGFVALTGWWGIVYYITFHTDMGWDLVEPITYLVGLTTVLGGYWWFLYISRDLSYSTAMKITVSKRQSALYQERGFDEAKWEQLVQEANLLRRDIRMAAEEYDIEWNEMKDLGGEEVKEVLEAEKQKSAGGNEDSSRNDDEDGSRRDRSKEKSQGSSKTQE